MTKLHDDMPMMSDCSTFHLILTSWKMIASQKLPYAGD